MPFTLLPIACTRAAGILLVAACILLGSPTATAQSTSLFAWPGATLYDGSSHDAAVLTTRIADGTLTARGFDALLLPDGADGAPLADLVATAHQHGLRVVLPIGGKQAGPHMAADTYVDAVGRLGIDALYLVEMPPDLDVASMRREAGTALRQWQQAQNTAAKEALGLWVFSTTPHAAADAHIAALNTEALDQAYAKLADRVAAEDAHPLHHLMLDAQTTTADVAHLLLAPGSVLVTMTDAANADTQELAAKLLDFRHRHAALALGRHEQLEADPYSFYRGVQVDMTDDKIIAVVGAGSRTRLNVSRVFPDDTALRDALSGKISMVSYGLISFRSTGEILLLEVVE